MLPHEPNSDELFEQLRSKLHDFGSAPPPAAWEQIQAQLPPARPAAQPMLRRRPGRGQLAAMLAVLLISVVTWAGLRYTRHAAAPTAQTQPMAPLTKPGNLPSASPAADPATLAAGSPAPIPDASTATTPTPPASGSAPVHPPAATTETATVATSRKATHALAAVPSRQSAAEVGTAAGEPATALPAANGTVDARRASTAAAATTAATRKTTDNAARRSTKRATRVAGTAAPSPAASQPAAGIRNPQSGSSRSLLSANKPRLTPAATRLAARNADPGTTAEAATSSHTKFPRPKSARTSAARQQTPAWAPANATNSQLADEQPNRTRAAAAAALSAGTTRAPGTGSAAASGVAYSMMTEPLLLRNALAVAPKRLPGRLSGTTISPAIPLERLPVRWSIQLSAGPALTHRRLAAGTSDSLTRQRFQNGQLERAARGHSAQLLVGYQLTPAWSLHTGLGYAEYRQNFRLSLVDTVARSVRQQDTYRFLAVPLLAEYEVGQAGKWSWRLNGGTLLQFYQGGRTTQGASCLCEQVTRTATDTLFRARSMSVQLGAVVRYQVSLRGQLQARPFARYMVSSLRQPTATAVPNRYLWAAGLEVGYSLDLW